MSSRRDLPIDPEIFVEGASALDQWAAIKGKPYITVSAKGIVNGLSTILNDGADFGPDTTLGATAPGQYGAPYTETGGIMEAKASLPKVKNPSTLRSVPSGTIKIIFDGQPIFISEPLQFYDDEFVSVASDGGFTLPIQPPNTPITYIQNKNSPSIIQVLRNPANSTLPNGILGFDGIVLYNNISSPSGSPQTVFNFVSVSGNLPNPSQLKIGTMGVYDSTGTNALAYISTNGNDDNIQIGNLVAVGGTGVGYNLVVTGVNHLYAGLIHILSNTGTDTSAGTGNGWMFQITPGGNAQIDILDCFSYYANGVLDVEPSGGTQSLTGAKVNINTFYDETGGVYSTGYNENDVNGSSSFRAVTVIANLSSAGDAFKSIASGYSQYLYLLTAMNSINSSTVSGPTAGTVNMYATLWTPLDRKYTIEFSGYENDTTTNQSIPFPSGFTFINTPVIIVNTTGLTISVTTTGITITAPDSTTTYSGIVVVEGY